jgi:hypothetical protein
MDVFFLIIVVLIFAGAFYAQLHQRSAQEARWKALAARRGLSFQPGNLLTSPRLAAQIDGTDVVIDMVTRKKGKTSVRYARATAAPSLALPAGLHIAPEGLGSKVAKLVGGQDIEISDLAFDQRARIQAHNAADVQALFADAQLTAACMTLFSTSRFNQIANGSIILEKLAREGGAAELLMEQSASLAAALTAARLRPWQRLAKVHSLTLTTRSTQIRLAGTLDGLKIAATADPSKGLCRLSVRVPADLPPALWIVSGRSPDAVSLGDPILDSTITASGAPTDVLSALLRGDALRGELLSVLHAFPESSVHSGFVHMVLPSASSLELSERVEDACRLARALAARTPEPEPEPGRQSARKTQRQQG